MTIGIQGKPGAFHEVAARQFFGDDIEIVGYETFAGVFEAIRDGKVDAGLAGIENSLYGSINDTYDLLVKHNCWIGGEVYLAIHMQLIGLPGTELETIKEVHSQNLALGQCEAWLDKHMPWAKRVEQHDTAASVSMVKFWDDPSKAAIASEQAAELYGLSILRHNIEDHKHNYTRFLVLYRTEPALAREATDKTSLILTTGHQPGSLHRALGVFAEKDINLSKLQSRHIPGERWKYLFYIDIEAGIHEPRTRTALIELERQGCTVRILGSYTHGDFPEE